MTNKSLNDKVLDILIEEAMEKYAMDIANEDPIYDMTDEEIQRMEQQKNRIYKKTMAKIKGRRISYKKIIILAATLVLLMSLALNTSAIRTFLTKTKIEIVDSTLYITTSKIDESRYDAITEFAYKDELIVPKWLPYGTELTGITDNEFYIYLYFVNDEKWIRFNQQKKGERNSWIETEKYKFDFTECSVLGMDGKLIYITSGAEITAHMAVWSSDNAQYKLTTNYDKKTLEKILKNLKYYN